MRPWQLNFVRKDDEYVVFTEHPDYIHPRDMSASLRGKYGESNVKVYLVQDIYVIYINRNAVNTSEISSLPTTDPANKCCKPKEGPTSDCQPNLSSDIKKAREVLIKFELSRS